MYVDLVNELCLIRGFKNAKASFVEPNALTETFEVVVLKPAGQPQPPKHLPTLQSQRRPEASASSQALQTTQDLPMTRQSLPSEPSKTDSPAQTAIKSKKLPAVPTKPEIPAKSTKAVPKPVQPLVPAPNPPKSPVKTAPLAAAKTTPKTSQTASNATSKLIQKSSVPLAPKIVPAPVSLRPNPATKKPPPPSIGSKRPAQFRLEPAKKIRADESLPDVHSIDIVATSQSTPAAASRPVLVASKKPRPEQPHFSKTGSQQQMKITQKPNAS